MMLALSRFFWYAVDLESCSAPVTLTFFLNLTTNMCVFFCFPNHLTGRWGGKLGSGWKLYLILQTVCKLWQSLEHERICFSFRPASSNESGGDLGVGESGTAGFSLSNTHLGDTCDLNILVICWGWLSGEVRTKRNVCSVQEVSVQPSHHPRCATRHPGPGWLSRFCALIL